MSRRLAELLALYLGTPLLLLVLPPLAERLLGIRLGMWVIPVLLVLATAVYAVAKARGALAPGELLRLDVPAREWGRMLLRFALCAALLTLLLRLHNPEALFVFPRRNPRFWALVMVCYPVLSVTSQGVLYRWLFERRYARLFSRTGGLVAGAALFSFAHILFRNPFALVFTFAGGLLFLGSYRRTGSVLFSNVEHALYGDFLFTVGWGAYFFEGTQRLVQTAL